VERSGASSASLQAPGFNATALPPALRVKRSIRQISSRTPSFLESSCAQTLTPTGAPAAAAVTVNTVRQLRLPTRRCTTVSNTGWWAVGPSATLFQKRPPTDAWFGQQSPTFSQRTGAAPKLLLSGRFAVYAIQGATKRVNFTFKIHQIQRSPDARRGEIRPQGWEMRG